MTQALPYVHGERLDEFDAAARARLADLHAEAARVVASESEETPAECPGCGADDWVRDGFATRRRGEPVQVFRCRACGKKRVGRSDSVFKNPLFAPEVMVFAVLLQIEGWTLKRIAEVVGIEEEGEWRSPNRQTVGRWSKRFRDLVQETVERLRADLEAPTDEPPESEPQSAEAPEPAPQSRGEPRQIPREPIGGRFEVLERLSGDERAGVHVVRDRWRAAGERLALKVLAPEGDRSDLGHEFLLRTRLRHPNLAGVRDFGVLADGRRWFTQELVSGDDLFVAARGVPFEKAVEWMVGVLRGVAYLHGRGIVHRDLKPENILVDAEGVPHIVDFGISVSHDDGESKRGPSGSPGYLAPEVLTGAQPEPTVDLYALAVTFHHVLGRELPKPGEPLARLSDKRQDVPAWFDEMLARMVHRRPAERFPSAGQVIEALATGSGIRFAQETTSTLDDRIRGGELVGREAELAQLDAALAPESRAVGALVVGPPGIGKSRLLETWRQMRQLAGGEVVAGSVGTILRAVVARLGGGHPLVVHHLDVVRRLCGGDPSDEGEARPMPLRTRDGLLRDRDAVLQLIAAGHPAETVVLVDELDTVDEATLAVIDALIGRAEAGDDEGPAGRPPGPMLLMAAREPDPRRTPRWSRALERHVKRGALAQIQLRPLAPSAVQAILDDAFDHTPIARELAPRISEATEGNPRFVEELLRALVDQGAVSRDQDGNWSVAAPDELPVPGGLVDACRARTAALAATELMLLRHLAVATGPVPRAAAVLVAGERPLVDLMQRSLVREAPGGVAVAHEGVREAALSALDPDSLRGLNRAMADAIEEVTDEGARPVELLARLLMAGDSRVRALSYLQTAARRARERFEVEEALRWLQDLDRLLSHPRLSLEDVPAGLREQTLRDLVHMLRFRGRYDEQSVVLDRLTLVAQTRSDTPLLLEAAAMKALTWFDRGRLDLARQICQGHLPTARELGDRRAVARFLWLLAMVERTSGALQEGLELSDEALGILGDETDPEALELRVQNHNNRGVAYGQMGNLERAVAALERALSLSTRYELVSSAIVNTMNLGICYAMQCRYGRALEHFDRARSQARRLGWRELAETLGVNQAVVEQNLGLAAPAVARLEPMVAAFEPGRLDYTSQAARCTLASCRLAQGDLKGAAALIEAALAQSDQTPGPASARLWLVEAEVRLAEGTVEARGLAVKALQRVVDGAFGPHERALAAARLAAIALDRGELDLAGAHSRMAYERFTGGPVTVREGLIETLHTHARVLLAAGQRADASSALERAADELMRQAEGLDGDALAAFMALPLHREVAEDAQRLLERSVTPQHVAADSRAEARAEELRDVLKVAKQLVRAPSLSTIVDSVLDAALRHSGMERGYLLVRESERFVAIGGRRAGRTPVDPGQARPEEALLQAMVARRGPVDEHDARQGEDAGHKPTLAFCRLALPLIWGDELVGAVYLESARPLEPYDEHRWSLLESLADQATIGVHHHLQVDEIERLRRRAEAQLTQTRARLEKEAARRQQAERAAAAERRVTRLRYDYDQIIHGSGAMREVLSQVDRVVDRKITVLIYGESGTGKELIARAVHHNGPRADGPFVAINCGAIPSNLIESELFGHVRGAFTGATKDRPGHFELAHGGTLFLDEIGEVSPDVQVRLLRVLETSEVTPVGSSRKVKVDVRIVAATNRDLKEEVREGRFREDLYYRLNTIAIRLPPLRERLEDLPLLVDYFAARVGKDRGEPPVSIGPKLMARLSAHDWPGNVRELRNVVEYATLFADDGVVAPDISLPF